MKALLTAFSLLIFVPLMAHTEDFRNILTVVGQGKTTVLATISDVHLGVEVQGKNAQDVQQAIAQQMAPVIALLKKEKVDKLQTGSVYIAPQYSRDTPSYIIGYTGSNTISFSTPIERSGSLIDAAIQAGANKLQSLTQRPDDAALARAQQEAIKAAIDNANEQAKTALQSLGLKQRQIVKVSVQPSGGYMPVFQHSYKAARMDTTEILPQEQDVQASVTVEISFE